MSSTIKLKRGMSAGALRSSILRVRSVNSLGFTAGLFFCDQADLKRYSRLKNQSASIDASGSAGFIPVSEHHKKNRAAGWG